MKHHRTMASAAILMLIVLWLVGGCGGGGSDKSGIQLYIADDPLDAKEVNVTITRVDVCKDEDGWVTLRDFSSNPLTINLLDYQYDGNSATPDYYLLADSPLTEGHYTQVRLILSKIEIVDNTDTTYDCEMSSQDQTGLKLIGQFDVASGAKTAVLIDFNAAKSIVAMGNGGYRLQPTVKVVPLQISGSLHGTVVFKDAAGSDIAVPDGATISAYQGATLAGTALIDTETGLFGMNGMVAGDYVLKLETDGYSADDASVTVTVGDDADAGTITATAVAGG